MTIIMENMQMLERGWIVRDQLAWSHTEFDAMDDVRFVTAGCLDAVEIPQGFTMAWIDDDNTIHASQSTEMRGR